MDPFWIHFVVVSLQRQIKTGMEKELKTNKETSANFIILENEEVTRLAEVSPIYIITESNRQYPMTWLAYLDYLDYYIAIDALEAICKE